MAAIGKPCPLWEIEVAGQPPKQSDRSVNCMQDGWLAARMTGCRSCAPPLVLSACGELRWDSSQMCPKARSGPGLCGCVDSGVYGPRGWRLWHVRGGARRGALISCFKN